MKIPNEIRIGGVDVKVSVEESVMHEHVEAYGVADCSNSTIKLCGNNQDHQHMCIALLHEIGHIIADQFYLELEDKEERIVDAFAHGIYQVLQDNDRKLFDIVPKGVTTTGYIQISQEKLDEFQNSPIVILPNID